MKERKQKTAIAKIHKEFNLLVPIKKLDGNAVLYAEYILVHNYLKRLIRKYNPIITKQVMKYDNSILEFHKKWTLKGGIK